MFGQVNNEKQNVIQNQCMPQKAKLSQSPFPHPRHELVIPKT